MTTASETGTVYLVTLNRPTDGRFEWGGRATGTDNDALTFYATDSEYSDMRVCLFLPESDPRHVGMWQRSRSAGEWGTVGEWKGGLPEWATEGQGTMYGWHVTRDALAAIEPLPDDFGKALTMSADVDVPEFVNTTFGEVPVGTEWANVGLWDSVHWVKVSDTHYVLLDNNGMSTTAPTAHECNSDYPVTIRNPEYGQWHTITVTPRDNSDVIETAKREERERLNREFEAWKARASEIAVKYANNNDLCSEFDRCMEEIGLEFDRSTEYDVTVRYTFTVSVPRGESVEGYLSGEYAGYVDVDYPDSVDYSEA